MINKFLSEYNFGDCEIKGLLFDFPHAIIIINDPHESHDLHIKILEVGKMIFCSDSTQNVIGKLLLFYAKEYNDFLKKYRFLRDNHVSFADIIARDPNALIIYAHGIAGGDFICQAKHVECNTTKSVI